MNIVKKESSDVLVQFEVTVPASDLDSMVDKEIQEHAKQAKMPGFRKGHVPLDQVRARFLRESIEDSIQKCANQAASQIFKVYNVHPITSPSFDIKSYAPGKDLVLNISVEQKPEVTVNDLSELKIEKLVCPVTEEEIETVFKKLDEQHTELTSVDRPAKKGDTVVLRLKSDSKKEESDPDEIAVQIDDDRFPFLNKIFPDLTGVKKGDIVPLPDRFKKKRPLNEPTAVIVMDVQESQKAHFTEEFFKTTDYGSLEKFKAAIRRQLELQREIDLGLYHKRRVMDALAEQYKFEVPKSLIDQDFNNILKMADSYEQQNTSEGEALESNGKQQEESDSLQANDDSHKTVKGTYSDQEEANLDDPETRKEFQDVAERRVRLGFVLREIAKKFNIEPTHEQLTDAVSAHVANMSERERQYYRKNKKYRFHVIDRVRSYLFEECVIQTILEKASITEKAVTKDELEEVLHEFVPDEMRYQKDISL